MINSRSLDDLHPLVKAKAEFFLAKCNEELASQGVNVIPTCTYRDFEAQNELYAQGRSKPGNVVTKAKGGESYHNYKVALDVLPIRNGKPVWGTSGKDLQLWRRIGEIGKECGFEWAGDWVTFREYPHFQFTGGLKLADFKAGRTL